MTLIFQNFGSVRKGQTNIYFFSDLTLMVCCKYSLELLNMFCFSEGSTLETRTPYIFIEHSYDWRIHGADSDLR